MKAIKYSIWHLHVQSQQKKQTNKQNTRTMCPVYPKLTLKTPKQCLVLLLLTLNIFWHYYIVIITEFEQIDGGWVWETIVSDNKFVSSNCGKYIFLWAGKVCLAACFHPYSSEIRLWKDKRHVVMEQA